MASLTFDAIRATFGTVDTTFSLANNKTSTDLVGTSNQALNVDTTSDGYQNLTVSTYYSVAGQYITNYSGSDGQPTTGLSYSIFQPVFKFEIPFNLMKTITSAKLRFQKQRITNLSNYSSSFVEHDFNLRLGADFKRYPPDIISGLPLLGTFDNNSGSQEIVIPNAANYISGYNIYFIFSDVNQENNIQTVPDPSLNDSNMSLTGFSNIRLDIQYEELTNLDTRGFRHSAPYQSGLIELPPNFEESIFPQNSGFIRVTEKEEIGCGVLFPGSGHQLRNYEIICAQRALQFGVVTTNENRIIYLEIPPQFRGQSPINIYRWNVEPNSNNLDFSMIDTLPLEGGLASLVVAPGKRWFHFGQFNPNAQSIRPIRLDEFGGKLVSIGF